MKARNEEIGTGEEGAASVRARVGGDRGGQSAGRGDAARRREGELADAALQTRRRTDGGGARGTRAGKGRNAAARTGPRNTGRRTSAAEAGSRKGLASTVTRLKKRAGGRTASTTRRSTSKGR